LYNEAGLNGLWEGQNAEIAGMERILEQWRDLDYREPTLKIICPCDYSRKRFGLFVDGCPNLNVPFNLAKSNRSGTIRLYLMHVAASAQHFHRSPDQLGAEHIRQYQLFLIQEKKLAWSSYNQIVCALRFFYGKTLQRAFLLQDIPFPRKEHRVPLILSRAEVARILTSPPHLKSRARLMTISAAGLRRSEVARLRVIFSWMCDRQRCRATVRTASQGRLSCACYCFPGFR